MSDSDYITVREYEDRHKEIVENQNKMTLILADVATKLERIDGRTTVIETKFSDALGTFKWGMGAGITLLAALLATGILMR